MGAPEKFTAVFYQLKAILCNYETEMNVKVNTDQNYYLETFKVNPKNNAPIFFGAVQIKKNYVSYHLMPVYACPDLLDSMSETLKKRMQGKSCFNFKAPINEELLRELEKITEQGLGKFKNRGYV